MPTPVGSARQCLAGDAASALDDAVSVARRRAHAQTTSLHVVFALISTSAATSPTSPAKPTSTSSLLRDALSRARSSAYSPRLQFKALELCFSVALDRLPSTSSTSGSADDPPVSNSLMAAVKRSQASQRRHPDTFHFYQQQQMMSSSSSSFSTSPTSPSTSSFSGVKVELQQLVLAILDDPVVSRVFGEAGFSSQDIKLAVLRPPPPILRFPHAARCPPLFLCNFSAAPADEISVGNDDNCRRIGEILARATARNPMLVGVGAADAAIDFAAALEQHKWDVLPAEITGLRYVGIEGRVSDARLEELGRRAEKPGVVIGMGDLKGLLELGVEVVNSLVSEMTRVLDLYRGRIWVMGWSANYEIYMKFLSWFPMLDRDWDLQLLPITSQKAGVGGGLLGRPQSLMESFVPFGGFFTTTYESPRPITKSYPSSPRCHNCNDQYEQELSAILKDRSPPLEDRNQTNVPSWLQKVDMNSSPNAPKAKDDGKLLDERVVNLQKKWNDRCQQLHHALLKLETNRRSVLPSVIGLPFISDKERVINQKGQHPAVSQSQSGSRSALPMEVGLRKISAPSLSISLPMVSEPIDKDLISKFQAGVSKSKQLPSSYVGTQDGRTSPSSVTSVTTDLVLGTPRVPCIAEKTALSRHNECSNDNEFQQQVSSGPKGCLSSCQKIDTSDFKSFYTGLLEKVGRQQEAICAISQAIIDCRSGNGRRRGASRKGDIWLSFHGPDRFGKKKIASFLAELVLGGREKLICIDLGYQESFVCTNTICDRQEVNQFDVELRGKTVSDRITAEITKKPISVVFLDNIEEADPLVQNSLLQAVRTGKIPDSHGRELSIHNAIFIVSSKTLRGKILPPRKEGIRFSEEMILSAQGWQMKILVEPILDTMCRSPTSNVSISSMQESWNRKILSKRKMDISDHQAAQPEYLGMKRAHKLPTSLLDLNLPVEVVEEDTNCSSTNIGGSDEKWAEEILDLMDETVNFKPFDFDALADSVLKQISRRLRDTIAHECSMEIDVKVMQQILASTWLLEDKRDLDNWLNEVLCQSFIELRRRFSNKLFGHNVLRLVSFEEALKDEYAPGMLLPSRIILD